MKKLFLALLLFLWAQVAAAQTVGVYWASSSGSNSATCTDIDGAGDPGLYGTIERAVACANADGSTSVIVWIKPGTYTSNVQIVSPRSNLTVSGTSATKANWPVIAPTTGFTTSVNAVHFTSVTRTSITFRYIKWDLSGYNGAGGCLGANSTSTVTFVTMEDFECKGPDGTGAIWAADTGAAIGPSDFSTGWIIRRGKIYNWLSADGSPGAHCFYWAGSSGLIEHTECTNVNGYGIQFFGSGVTINDNIFRYNYFHGMTLRGPVYIQSAANRNKLYNNIFADWFNRAVTFNGTETDVINNTFYEASSVTGIFISGCGGSCKIANNLIVTAGTAISGSNANITQTTNRTSTSPSGLMIDAPGGNFSLVESSPAIDGGTVISGFSEGRYVGAGVDQGALEACIRTSAVAENATPTIYSVSYSCPSQSVRNGVGLQTPTVGNWAIRDDGANMTENSAAIRGTSIVDITLSASLTAGVIDDAHTRSSAPSLMDNVGIGDVNGVLTTNFHNAYVRTHAATDVNVKNNIGGGGGVTFNVVHARQISWYSSIGSPTWKRIQDAAGGAQAGGRVAMAITIEGTGANPDATAFELYFNTGGGDSLITDSVATNAIGFVNDAPSFTDQAAISSLLSGLTCPHGTFVAGAVVGKQTSQPNVDLAQDSCTTLIVLLQTKSDASGTINIKPKLPGGTAINYGVTPSITIKKAEARS